MTDVISSAHTVTCTLAPEAFVRQVEPVWTHILKEYTVLPSLICPSTNCNTDKDSLRFKDMFRQQKIHPDIQHISNFSLRFFFNHLHNLDMWCIDCHMDTIFLRLFRQTPTGTKLCMNSYTLRKNISLVHIQYCVCWLNLYVLSVCVFNDWATFHFIARGRLQWKLKTLTALALAAFHSFFLVIFYFPNGPFCSVSYHRPGFPPGKLSGPAT